jgi:hypothetical protein
MKPIFKIIPLSILALTFLCASWLGTSTVHASIPAVIAELTPEGVTALITAWGQVILMAFGVIAAVVIAGIGYVRAIQKKLNEKIAERAEVSAAHHEQIAQMNTQLPTPLNTIAPPTNPPPQ